jgi:predicted RNase H-like HicB family nuclease/predicted RNA binding protein YcfA (HicA-like mRNA interferase family)
VTARRNGKKIRRARNPSYPGYPVTVPLLPAVITYGRTLEEAREMACDAIRWHLEGLRKDGEPIAHPQRKDRSQRKAARRTGCLDVTSFACFEAKEVLRALLKSEFEVHHQKTGSHAQLRHPSKPHLSVTSPRHHRFDFPQPILMSTLGRAEMTLEDFLRYL